MSHSPRIALVTGASKGIGKEIASQLSSAGVYVILASRNMEQVKANVDKLKSEGLLAEHISIDVCDEQSVERAVDTIAKRHGRLDIFVNNAGIVDPQDGPPTKSSTEAVRRLMETNFIGTLSVTQAMLPLLRHSSAGRIVNLATSLASLYINGDPTSPYYNARLIGYNASKAALNMLTVQLAAELRDTNIKINSVSPGYVKTDLTSFQGFMTAEEGARLPVEYALKNDKNDESGTFVEPGGKVTPW